jgi:hypothetical protein
LKPYPDAKPVNLKIYPFVLCPVSFFLSFSFSFSSP